MKELKREWKLVIITGLATAISLILFFTSSGIVHEITRWTIFFSSAFFARAIHNIIWPKVVRIKDEKQDKK